MTGRKRRIKRILAFLGLALLIYLVWWRWLQVRRAMERRPVDWERYKSG